METTTQAESSRIPSRRMLRITRPNPSLVFGHRTTPLSFRIRKGAFIRAVQSFAFTHEISIIRLLIDYRWFDAVRTRFRHPLLVAVAKLSYQKQIAPRFEFGFGLSYTAFAYSDLTIEMLSYGQQFPEDAIWDSGMTPSTNTTGASRAIWLHRPVYCISFYVQNVGGVAGTDVS